MAAVPTAPTPVAAPKLKVTAPRRYVGEIRYSDLDRFLIARFGLRSDWSCVADQEWHNDTINEVHVESSVDTYDRNEMLALLAGRPKNWCLGTLLDTLCERGEIPAGTYLVRVDY